MANVAAQALGASNKIELTDKDFDDASARGTAVDFHAIFNLHYTTIQNMTSEQCEKWLVYGKVIKDKVGQLPTGGVLTLHGLEVKKGDEASETELNLQRATAMIALHAKAKGFDIGSAMYRRMPDKIQAKMAECKQMMGPGVHFLMKLFESRPNDGIFAEIMKIKNLRGIVALMAICVDWLSYSTRNPSTTMSIKTFTDSFLEKEKGAFAGMLTNSNVSSTAGLALLPDEAEMVKSTISLTEFVRPKGGSRTRVQNVIAGIKAYQR